MTGIADTGFLVAFLNRRDAHHVWACRLAERIYQVHNQQVKRN